MGIILLIMCCFLSVASVLQADQHVYQNLIVDKLISKHGQNVDGDFTVNKKSTFNGEVIFGDNVFLGTKVLGDIKASDKPQDMIKITMPFNRKIMGIAKVIFCGLTSFGRFQTFKAKYVFGADSIEEKSELYIKRIKYSQFNHKGFMDEPLNPNSIYARSLNSTVEDGEMADEIGLIDDGWISWVENAVSVRFLPPTRPGAHLSDVVVFYEVKVFSDLVMKEVDDGDNGIVEVDALGLEELTIT